MAFSDSRAIVVTVATLALVGCCLFVLHAEDITTKFESVKTDVNKVLKESEKSAAAAAGAAAQAPKGFLDKENKPKWHETPAPAPGSKTWVAHGKLQHNCVALKAYAYNVADGLAETSFKDLGVVYNLLMAMIPTPDPKKDNSTPLDCANEYKKFVAKTSSAFPAEDSLPVKMLGSIQDAMEGGKGLLVTVHKKNANYIVLNGQKLGLNDLTALTHIKGMMALQDNVFNFLRTMKGSYGGVAASIEHAKVQTLSAADAKILKAWKGA